MSHHLPHVELVLEEDATAGSKTLTRAPKNMEQLYWASFDVGIIPAWLEFLAAFNRNPNQEAVVLPPPSISHPLKWAFMAGCAECLARRNGWVTPTWTKDPTGFLDKTICLEVVVKTLPHEDRVRTLKHIEAHTPLELKRRGILVSAEHIGL